VIELATVAHNPSHLRLRPCGRPLGI
jgi:hypothetical protein